ncbi:MAG TPA: hypothetical protein VFT93_06110 [Candidatus Eisenbacteria bacterium]|nr:hypothetical protein [Candidatus Eisenbacteria bacterium]
MDSFESFEQAACKAFGFLCDRFGFQSPEIERLGRESYVHFQKGPRIVSIAWEPGTAPIVELFLPTEGSGLPATPWAERDGIPYSRRFPGRIGSASGSSNREGPRRDPHAWKQPTTVMFEEYLAEEARNLEDAELIFIS